MSPNPPLRSRSPMSQLRLGSSTARPRWVPRNPPRRDERSARSRSVTHPARRPEAGRRGRSGRPAELTSVFHPGRRCHPPGSGARLSSDRLARLRAATTRRPNTAHESRAERPGSVASTAEPGGSASRASATMASTGPAIRSTTAGAASDPQVSAAGRPSRVPRRMSRMMIAPTGMVAEKRHASPAKRSCWNPTGSSDR